MIRKKLLCDLLNLHSGHADKAGDWMMFYCTRCEQHVHPISPEGTEEITRELYDEEGYDYDELH